MNNLISVLQNFAKVNNERIKLLLSSSKKNASNKLSDSLDYNLTLDVERLKYELELTGINYTKFVLGGRGKNKLPIPNANLQAWMKIKGIPLKFTVPIKKSIVEKGIPSFDFIDMIFTDKVYSELGEELGQSLADEITQKIKFELE